MSENLRIIVMMLITQYYIAIIQSARNKAADQPRNITSAIIDSSIPTS